MKTVILLVLLVIGLAACDQPIGKCKAFYPPGESCEPFKPAL
jgi:hypothetical protein